MTDHEKTYKKNVETKTVTVSEDNEKNKINRNKNRKKKLEIKAKKLHNNVEQEWEEDDNLYEDGYSSQKSHKNSKKKAKDKYNMF